MIRLGRAPFRKCGGDYGLSAKGASKKRMVPHFVHHLGPPFMIEREIRSGPIRNRRAWCRLDELLTAKTVEDAANRSRKHLRSLEA